MIDLKSLAGHCKNNFPQKLCMNIYVEVNRELLPVVDFYRLTEGGNSDRLVLIVRATKLSLGIK